MTPGTSDFAIRKEMEWEVLLSSGDSLIGGIPRWRGQKDFVGKIPRLMSHTRQRERRGSERPRPSFCPDRRSWRLSHIYLRPHQVWTPTRDCSVPNHTWLQTSECPPGPDAADGKGLLLQVWFDLLSILQPGLQGVFITAPLAGILRAISGHTDGKSWNQPSCWRAWAGKPSLPLQTFGCSAKPHHERPVIRGGDTPTHPIHCWSLGSRGTLTQASSETHPAFHSPGSS